MKGRQASCCPATAAAAQSALETQADEPVYRGALATASAKLLYFRNCTLAFSLSDLENEEGGHHPDQSKTLPFFPAPHSRLERVEQTLQAPPHYLNCLKGDVP